MDHTRKLLLLLESDPKAISLPLLGMYVCNILLKISSFCCESDFLLRNTFHKDSNKLCSMHTTVIDNTIMIIVFRFFEELLLLTLPVNVHILIVSIHSWVSGIYNIHHQFVWACCLRFVHSTAIQQR